MEMDPFSRALAALASPAVDPNARREAEAFGVSTPVDAAALVGNAGGRILGRSGGGSHGAASIACPAQMSHR